MRKGIAACLLGVMGTMGALGNACAQSNEAYQLMQATNEDRAQHGLGPLKWDPALARAAQRHAELMVRQGALSHQYPGEAALETRVGMQGAHFRVVAENLAVAPNPGAVEAEWMHSPPHRRNILDARLNEIGIGLVRQGGNLWAVEDFTAGVAALGSSQIERTVAQMLSQRGLRPAGDVAAARQTCADGLRFGRRTATEIHHALAGLRIEPLTRSSRATDQYRTLPHGSGRSLQRGQ